MSGTRRKILSPEELREEREQLRAQGQRVVQCHGCFDIVHPGHLRYLEFAKAQGDVLIVSVSSDAVVGKGFDRPYIHEDLRLENLAALEVVDYVVLDDHDWAGPILETLKPDVYVKGKEYETKGDPRFAREKALVEDHGGRVIYSSGDVVYSSTRIISSFRGRFAMEGERIAFFCRQHGVHREALAALLKSMRGLRVVVVGDAILDRYVHCDADTGGSEAPVVTVHPQRREDFPGGAALIAAQVAALGGRATLVVPALEPAHRREFIDALTPTGVDLIEAGVETRPVYVKTRYLAEDTKVLKVNEGRYAPMSTQGVAPLLDVLRAELSSADGLVATDFGYGLFGQAVTDGLIEISAQTGVPYFADVSGAGRASVLKFKGARLATPTEQELRFAYADPEAGLSNLASRTYADTGIQELVLTMGKRGVLLFDPPGDEPRMKTAYLPALSTGARDPVGAGDIFLATLTLATLAGGDRHAHLYLASAAAAFGVERIGNNSVGLGELEAFLATRPELTT